MSANFEFRFYVACFPSDGLDAAGEVQRICWCNFLVWTLQASLLKIDLLADSLDITNFERDLNLSEVLGVSSVDVCCATCHRTVCHAVNRTNENVDSRLVRLYAMQFSHCGMSFKAHTPRA